MISRSFYSLKFQNRTAGWIHLLIRIRATKSPFLLCTFFWIYLCNFVFIIDFFIFSNKPIDLVFHMCRHHLFHFFVQFGAWFRTGASFKVFGKFVQFRLKLSDSNVPSNGSRYLRRNSVDIFVEKIFHVTIQSFETIVTFPVWTEALLLNFRFYIWYTCLECFLSIVLLRSFSSSITLK